MLKTKECKQLDKAGKIFDGTDPNYNEKDLQKMVFDALNSNGFIFRWTNCNDQPYKGVLLTGGDRSISVSLFVQGINDDYIDAHHGEVKRIQFYSSWRNNLDKALRHVTTQSKCIILGVYTRADGAPVFCAWQANALKHKRRESPQSLYVKISELQEACDKGFCVFDDNLKKPNTRYRYTFLPEELGNYIDLLDTTFTIPDAIPTPSASSSHHISKHIHKSTEKHANARKQQRKKLKTETDDTQSLLDKLKGFKQTEKDAVVKQRIGQGEFRELLISRYECKCMLCEIARKEMLIASHIKRWTDSSDQERLDPDNGLLLCVHHDALFDKHLISFDEKGAPLVSTLLNETEKTNLGINAIPSIEVTPGMEKYLDNHRMLLKKK